VARRTCQSFVQREEGFGRTTTTAATTATRARVGNVDADPTAINLRIVHIVNGILGFRLAAKSHKTKTARAVRLAITHHDRLFKKMKEGGEGEIPAGVLVISFRERKKETEAYVNNRAE
jgi:hypothetical protein